MAAPVVTEAQKRTVACPKCGAAAKKPCRSSRIPGPNTFGGGWGGPPDLETAHRERRAVFLEEDAARKQQRAANDRARIGAQTPRIVIKVPAGPEPTVAQVQASVDAQLGVAPKPIDLMAKLREHLTGEAATLAPVSEMHPRPVHYMRRWSGKRADEAPLCGADHYSDRTCVGETHDIAGAPMPICPKCAEIAKGLAELQESTK